MRLEEAIFSSPTGRAAHISSLNTRQLWIVSRDNLAQYTVVWRSTGQIAVDVKSPVQKQLRVSQQWEAFEHFEMPALTPSTTPVRNNITREEIVQRLESVQQSLILEKELRPSALIIGILNDLHFITRAVQGAPCFSKRPNDKDFEPRPGVETTGPYGGRCVR